MKIYVDFDGTIVDVKKRFFSIIKNYFEINENYFDKYCYLKMNLCDDKLVLEKLLNFQFDYEKYRLYKKAYLEKLETLFLDTLLIDLQKLRHFFENNDAYILSCRNNAENAYIEYRKLNLDFLIEKTIIIKPNGENSKYEWIKDNCYEKCVMIGDSEVDINAGKNPNCITAFVKTGLRKPELLKTQPDYIFENLEIFIDYFEKEKPF